MKRPHACGPVMSGPVISGLVHSTLGAGWGGLGCSALHCNISVPTVLHYAPGCGTIHGLVGQVASQQGNKAQPI